MAIFKGYCCTTARAQLIQARSQSTPRRRLD
jgi:hypothetical protein